LQDLSRANIINTQSSIKLKELGPRMEMEVTKLEEGVCTGQVLYHKVRYPKLQTPTRSRDFAQ
jgi:hypothetical protein